jgi:hypothetical protein
MIQLMIRIGNGDAGSFQISDSSGDVAGGHVVPWIAVEEDDENAGVMTIRSKDNKVVQGFKVVAVTR